jgi:hypothetical protein
MYNAACFREPSDRKISAEEFHKKKYQRLHFNKRFLSRTGYKTNRHETKKMTDYLLAHWKAGYGRRNRKWFYCFFKTWCWVLLDCQTERLVTVVTETPHNMPLYEIERVMKWGKSTKRKWSSILNEQADIKISGC